MKESEARRDFGLTWKERLAEARASATAAGPRLTAEQIAELQGKVQAVDVGSPHDRALLWSGKDVLTGVPIDESAPDSPKWWDKLACREAEVFRALGLACSLEDTPGATLLTGLQLNYQPDDPLHAVARQLWEALSHRFVAAASGRIEIICEGAFDESVLRTIELDTVLTNPKLTAINGLARKHFGSDPAKAFVLLRRWDVERSLRYLQFIDIAADSTPHERAMALDDAREIQLWYEMDFYPSLGPNRELPPLPEPVLAAQDEALQACSWKYSAEWREFIRRSPP